MKVIIKGYGQTTLPQARQLQGHQDPDIGLAAKNALAQGLRTRRNRRNTNRSVFKSRRDFGDQYHFGFHSL